MQEDKRKKKPITYNFKWCKKQVCGGHNSDANLRKHRDGSNQAGHDGSGCSNKNLAISAGAKILPSVNKTKALCKKDKDGNKKLTLFFGCTKKFNKKTLNQILMIWQTRNVLPWSHIEYSNLNAAFHYAEPNAVLYKRKWASSKAKQLYVSLQGSMIRDLRVRFPLVKWLRKESNAE